MAISFNNALGNLSDNLKVYSRRAEILASNLANADTPGYKAKDIDFRSALSTANTSANTIKLSTTNKSHQGDVNGAGDKAEVVYRTPLQPSLDGNTVDSHVEQGEFTENAIRYQSTLTFLNGRLQSLKLAIKGQ